MDICKNGQALTYSVVSAMADVLAKCLVVTIASGVTQKGPDLGAEEYVVLFNSWMKA